MLKFLFDERLEFERRRLKQRQRLLELRRQHQRLRQARGELQTLNHLRGNLNQTCAKDKPKLA